MKIGKKFFVSGLLIVFFTFSLIAQKGHSIKVVIPNLADSNIILGHHWSTSKIPDDTITLDKNGVGIFKGKEALPQGIYFLFLPSLQYFDILVGDDQEFTIENDTVDFDINFNASGSIENELFKEYKHFLHNQRNKVQAVIAERDSASSDKEKEKYNKQIRSISDAVKTQQLDYIAQNEGTLFATFIKATLEIDVPDAPDGASKDWQYYYYRKHYFDNFNLADNRLLRTPFYNDKVIKYIDKVVPQVPDTIIGEVDMLIETSRGTEEMFRNMLVNLFNHYAKSEIMCMDKVFIHIAEKYYIPEASWSDSAFMAKLKVTVSEVKPTLCGNVAPDFKMIAVPPDHFKKAANDTALANDPHAGVYTNFHSVQADYYILAFWEADCGHCKKQMPVMYEVYKRLKEKDVNVQVIAMHMLGGIEGKQKWIKFTNDKEHYDWINAWNPYSYDYKKMYNIKSTPQVFVLDKDKKVIAKRISAEQAEEIINHYIQLNSSK